MIKFKYDKYTMSTDYFVMLLFKFDFTLDVLP